MFPDHFPTGGPEEEPPEDAFDFGDMRRRMERLAGEQQRRARPRGAPGGAGGVSGIVFAGLAVYWGLPFLLRRRRR